MCVAGAPVVDWAMYDTGYTERYMGLPKQSAQAYRNGSVLLRVDQFPDSDEDGDRLVIVHGLRDENVHFAHTVALVDALVAANKPYRLLVYPRERHGLRKEESMIHRDTTVLNLLLRNLG
jgi:dipeptidyl-peptidase 9